MKTLFSMITMICFFILYSCQKEAHINQNSSIDHQIELRDFSTLNIQDKKRVDFAKVFATALSDIDLRAYMKQQYTTIDANDDEFIYSLHYNDVITNNQTLSQILHSYASINFIAEYGNNFFTSIVTEDVLLAVDFPDVDTYTISTWDETSEIPEIAIATENEITFTDGSSGFPGWNSSGTLLDFDFQVEPNEVTLLVKTSEIYVALSEDLVFEDGTTLSEFFGGDPCDDLADRVASVAKLVSQDPTNKILLIRLQTLIEQYRDLCEDDDGGDDNGGNPCEDPCERDCVVADERLFKFRVADYATWDGLDCGWKEKYADFMCVITKDKNSVFSHVKDITIFNKRKRDLLNCSVSPCIRKWVFLTQPQGRFWNDWKENDIDNFHFTWTELGDGIGSIKEFKPTITASGSIIINGVTIKASKTIGGVTVDLTTGDCVEVKALGSDLDFYCDKAYAPGQLYSTGSIEFYVGQDATN